MKLPRSVQEIADVIGRERALFLVGQLPRCYMPDHKSGARLPGSGALNTRVILYVPKRLTPVHELVRILGWIDAEKLCQAFGGEILCPATCRDVYLPFRNAHIRRLSAAGVETSTIGEWFDMSPRQVTNVIAGGLAVVEIPQEDRKAANDESPPQHNTGRTANGSKRNRGGK